jgi:hypothetical protein
MRLLARISIPLLSHNQDFVSTQEELMRKLANPIWKLRYLLVGLTVLWAVPVIAQDAPKPAEEVYKNIQVLKGLPAPKLMEVMHSFTHSLGVHCSFCHVEGDFASDDNPKKTTARHMIEMAHAINKNNFNGEMRVTCWTCHRGAEEPESKAPDAGQPH